MISSRDPLRVTIAILLVCCPLMSQTLPSNPVKPDLAQRQTRMWQAIREALVAPNGAEYFRLNLYSTEVPGGAGGLRRLRGTVLSSQTVLEPRVVLLTMTNETAVAEVMLQFKSAWGRALPSGTEVEFSGIPRSFGLDPFLLTFEVIRFEVLPKPTPPSRPK